MEFRLFTFTFARYTIKYNRLDTKKEIDDEELGTIIICLNRRARRYRIAISDGKVIATLPPNGNETALMLLIEKNREIIKQALQTIPRRPRLDEQTQLQTATFRVQIGRQGRSDRFMMSLKDGVLQIVCPLNTDFTDDFTQDTLRQMIMAAMRHEAKRLLPARVDELAERHGFSHGTVRITSSRTRWGSCNSLHNINLSLHLMQLPWHLIDYIILHELCHTLEMNHSDRFWALMDKVTHGNSKALRQELKQYHML